MSGAAILPQLYRCPRCKADLPREAFGDHAHRKDGRASYCKPCARTLRREQDQAYRAANPKPAPPPKEIHYCDGCGEAGHNVTTCPDDRDAQLRRVGLERCPRGCGALLWSKRPQETQEHIAGCGGPPGAADAASRRVGNPTDGAVYGAMWHTPDFRGR